jgi:formylglycine-generating enzyme required for sulfatase activity
MMPVAGGTFRMGATKSTDSEASPGEDPLHDVTLSDFYIGKTEVTQALWRAVMGTYPSHFSGDNLPVERVSWNDCQEFIKKLNAKTGKDFRLPTEAEWEYAARGGNRSRGDKYSGSDNIGSVAWYNSNSNSKAHPVGTKESNELGIYDMSGNVQEWCGDWFGSYSSSSQTNPKGVASGGYRVPRGDSWRFDSWSCRSAWRGYITPDFLDNYIGFRLALPVK